MISVFILDIKNIKKQIYINNGNYHVHYFLEQVDDHKNISCKHCDSTFEQLHKISNNTITLKDFIPNFYRTKCTIRRGKYRCPNCNKIIIKDVAIKVQRSFITYSMLNMLYFEVKNLCQSINYIYKRF